MVRFAFAEFRVTRKLCCRYSSVMGNKDKAKKRRKSGPKKFQKSRGNRKRLPDDPVDVMDVVAPPTEPDDIPSSASAKKIYAVSSDADTCSGDNEYSFHYLIIDSELLQGIIDVVGKCPSCKESGLVVSNDLAERMQSGSTAKFNDIVKNYDIVKFYDAYR